jgi:hypothetical protein
MSVTVDDIVAIKDMHDCAATHPSRRSNPCA